MKNISTIHTYLNHYRNLFFARMLLKGILVVVILFFILGLLLLLADLAIHFSSSFLNLIRTLFTLYLLGLVFYYLLRPLVLWIFNMGIYNKMWIARKIGESDSEIDDKLINILELEKLDKDNNLVTASLEQKIGHVNLNKFISFFSFKTLLNHFLGFLFIVLITVVFYALSPNEVLYSTSRILPIQNRNSQAPYSITVVNSQLKVNKGSDFNLKVKVEGAIIPDKLKLKYGGTDHLFLDSSNVFSYKFRNLRNDITFQIFNDEYESETYTLNVLPVPIIQRISISIVPPTYTNLETESVKGTGSFTFPYGSTIKWEIDTYDTDSLVLNYNSECAMIKEKDKFLYDSLLTNASEYELIPMNYEQQDVDTLRFNTRVIPDQYPAINLSQQKTSLFGEFYFSGKIQDDYGFKDFHIVFKNADTTFKNIIPLQGNNLNQEFSYGGQLKDFPFIGRGSDVEIYLVLRDNDPFAPYKKVKTRSIYVKLPDKNELRAEEQKKVTKLQDKLQLGKDILEQVNKERQNLRKKLLNKDLSKWERKQLAQQIQNSSQEINKLQKQVNELREELKNIQEHSANKQLVEKKRQLEKMLDKLMDDELEKLMDELEKLQKELLNDKEIKSDKIDYSFEELENELDRNLEMLKRYEIEKNQREVIDELNELSKKFENVDSLLNKEGNQTDSLKQDLDKSFKKHKENLKKNKELSSPLDLKEFSEEKQKIQEKTDQLQQDQDLNNEENNPSEDLEKLSKQMQMNMQMAMQKQQGEDATMIRELLENLLSFSYKQEQLIDQFKNRQVYNFNKLRRTQSGLKAQFSVSKDSLHALMNRNAMVASAIGNQLESIDTHFKAIDNEFQKERFRSIAVHQQKIMQSTNELILMLNESLDNMNSMSGKGSQSKSGKKSKPGMGGMKKQQQSFKDALQKMIDELKKGSKSGKGKKGMSKQLSKMLGQQEKMQQLIQQLMQSGGVGQQSKQLLKEINKKVDQNIDDIIHKNINDNMLKRQQQILNRMLEAEKAEQEREKEKKRKSEAPNNFKLSNPKEKLEYKKDSKSRKGILYKQELPLKYFFQRKYDKYLNEIEKY